MNNIVTQNRHSYPVCSCPHCNSTFLTRSGFDRGIQRYRCKSCQRTFKATAGTPVHGLHKKEKIIQYLDAMREGMSVRKAAQLTGISKNTSFAWRHKFLSSLEARSVVQSADEIASVGLIHVNYSPKGRKKPPEKHRSPSKTVLLLRGGQLELHKLEPVRHTRHLAQIFTECSAEYFVAELHKTLTGGIKHSDKAIKIMSKKISLPLIAEVKQQATKLLAWMDRFKGVASKYLQNYWNWYTSLLNTSLLKNETDYFYRLCTNSRSLEKFLITKGI